MSEAPTTQAGAAGRPGSPGAPAVSHAGRWLPRWRWHNVVRLFRAARFSLAPGRVRPNAAQLNRLTRAERRGLQLAILLRTLVFAVALTWYVTSLLASGSTPTLLGFVALGGLTAIGVAHFIIIGTRHDRPWVKFVAVALDMAAIGAIYVLVPVNRAVELPQVYAFRGVGAGILMPFIALAALSLSPRLVLWTGACATVMWLAAFRIVVAPMQTRLSWSDIPSDATIESYNAIFLSPDFIGSGTRYTEALVLIVVAVVLAVAVARARLVFFAQIEAEAAREAERAARTDITQRLGRFVPSAIAERILKDPTALSPQVRHGAALVMDITGFTAYAEGRDPAEVIATLNAFLARCADEIATAHGVVITFTGDGLLATFNTPLELAAPETAALGAARALVACGERDGFDVRVGVSCGPIAAGSVGSSERQAFTVYGDTVNRAARLEALAKTIGGPILADAGCAECDPTLTACGEHDLHGFSRKVGVWSAPLAPLSEPAARPELAGAVEHRP